MVIVTAITIRRASASSQLGAISRPDGENTYKGRKRVLVLLANEKEAAPYRQLPQWAGDAGASAR